MIWETFRRQTSIGYPSYLQNRRCRYFTTTLLTDDGFSAYGILSTTVRNGWLYAEQQQRDIQRQSSIGTKEKAERDVRRSGVSRRYVRSRKSA